MGSREVVLSTVIPAVVSVIALVALHFVLGLMKRREAGGGGAEGNVERGDGRGPRLIGVGFLLLACGGVVLGSYAWQSEVSLWKDSVPHRAPAMALAALVVGLAGVLTPLRRSAVGLGVLGAAGGWFVGWAVLSGLHSSLIGETARWGWIGGVGVIAGVQAWAMAWGLGKLPGWRGPGLVWLVVGVGALGATAGLANAPLVLFPVAAAAFGLAAAGVFRRDADLLAGAVPAIAVVFMGVLALSNWFGDRERWVMFGVLSAAPMAIGLAALPVVSTRRVWVRLVIAGVVSVGLAGAIAGVSFPALLEASTGSGGSDYYDY